MFGVRPPKPEPDPGKEEAEQKLADRELDEPERVAAQRLLKFMDAGYPFEIAQQIAGRFDIDSQLACDLLAEGCLPKTAARILL